jgi:nucleoside-diphosphate-sugar epimerase
VRLFVFGLGYSATATALWLEKNNAGPVAISGTVRSGEKIEAARTAGMSVHLFDGASPGKTLTDDLAAATHVLFSAPPDHEGDPALFHHGADLERSAALQWLGYFSTVGVYGDAGGDWIDETAPLHPSNERAAWRITAEKAMAGLAADKALPLAILRLAGIYGPRRSAFDRLRAGTARRIIRPGQVFNRIHVDDIARLTASAAMNATAGTFNVSDDEPAPPQDLVAHAARLGGFDLPPEVSFETADLSDMARSFYSDNKRVSNRTIKRELGLELVHPTYREGLTAIFNAERGALNAQRTAGVK